MIYQPIKWASLLGVLGLPACGGGGTIGPTNYQTFDSTVAATNTIGGDVLQSNGTNGLLRTKVLTGNFQHDTGAIIVADGTFTMSDQNGFDANGLLTKGAARLQTGPAAGFAGNYAFARPFTQTYAVSGDAYNGTGILGLETSASDMPRTDTATYQGEAEAIVARNGDGFDLIDGKSTVVANFDDGRVNITLSDFTTINESTGATVTGPLDTILISDARITGNTFKSTEIETRLDGSVVDIVGGSALAATAGTFFGITSDLTQPDEVGGVLIVEGDNGLITGAFVAD